MEINKCNSFSSLPKGDYVLFGAGGMGQYVLKELKQRRNDISIIGFADDSKKGEVEGLPINRLESFENYDHLLITSSYWRKISSKLKGVSQVFIADFLSSRSETEVMEREVNGFQLKFFTPNKFLVQVSKQFEKIEPNLIEWIHSFEKGTTFYDIGASNGVYGIYAAIVAEVEVIAFEPDVQNFAIMDYNHYLNSDKIEKFTALNIGLGEKSGFLPLQCQEFLAGAHGKVFNLDAREQQSQMETEFTRNVYVDCLEGFPTKYNVRAPDYVKIDVDGAEKMILRGAKSLLASGGVKEWMIEVEESVFPEIHKMMMEYNYSLQGEYTINEVILTPVSGVKNYHFVKI
jgi:FkbM family methyltransferase